MISFEPFWETLRNKGITTYQLTVKMGISSHTLSRIKHNRPMTTAMLDRLCEVLECGIDGIMTYSKGSIQPDSEERSGS